MKAATLSVLLVIFASTMTAAPNSGWIDHYQQGRAAYSEGRWGDAADAMERALAENPTEQISVRVRSESISYVPHFWLGLSQLKLGETAKARASLSRSESQSVIQKTTHYTELRRALSQVEQVETKRSSNELTSLRTIADEAVAVALAAQGAATEAGATRNENYRRASTKLDDALAQTKGQPTAENYKQKATLARQAADLFAAAKTEIASANRPTRAPQQPAVNGPGVAQLQRAEVAPPPSELTKETLTQRPQSSAPTLRILRQLSELNRELRRDSEAFKKNPVLENFVRSSLRRSAAWESRLKSPVAENELAVIQQGMASIRKDLEVLRSASRPVVVESSPAPANRRHMLETAYRELSRGRLGQAETLLTEAITADNSLAEAFMLRGCVRYTSAMLASEKAGLESALADFRTALKINPTLRLELPHFSPKLIAFFETAAVSASR